MSAPRRDSDGNLIDRRRRTALPRNEPQEPAAHVEYPKHEYDESQRLLYVLHHFVNWDHGYLKIRRDSDGAQLHLTWTWTLTAARGTYVYVRCNYWEFDYGLDVLSRKVLEVDEGTRRPTPDKWSTHD